MTEIQGKSILVRVSARFKLARVQVIGSRLYITLFQKFPLLPLHRSLILVNPPTSLEIPH